MEKETITIRHWEINFILTVNQLNVIMDLINLTNITSAIILFLQSKPECFSELKLSVKLLASSTRFIWTGAAKMKDPQLSRIELFVKPLLKNFMSTREKKKNFSNKKQNLEDISIFV